MKITPHKNITTTKEIGDFVQTIQVPTLCQFSADLTSNKHCPPFAKKKRKLNETNKGHKVFFFMVELARFLVDSSFL